MQRAASVFVLSPQVTVQVADSTSVRLPLAVNVTTVLPALPLLGLKDSQDCEDAAVHAPVQVTVRVCCNVPP